MECTNFSVGNAWWIAAVAPLLCAQLTYLLMTHAQRFGLVDHPGGRKHHHAPTPLVGGLAIFLTLLLCAVFLGQVPGASWSLLAALLVTVAIGLADDAHEIGHRSKFVAQIIAALIIVSGTSVQVTQFGDLFGYGNITLGRWSPLVTSLAIIGLMNAINMIDGLDGLAGSQAFLGLLMLAGVALAGERALLALEVFVVVGAIAGFLYFNLRTPWRSRALTFMGDTGGLLLGLLLAWNSVQLASGSDAIIQPITAVWILALPLLDMGSVMLLRIAQRKSPFHADRQHMHHVLLKGGYSVSQVVGILFGFSLICAVGALVANRQGIPEYIMFYGFIALWAVYFAALTRPELAARFLHRFVAPSGTVPT
jgi:UDP-GlcNAc:undecaprenyl-phosphate GlcNAc-1-phosphate transferase